MASSLCGLIGCRWPAAAPGFASGAGSRSVSMGTGAAESAYPDRSGPATSVRTCRLCGAGAKAIQVRDAAALRLARPDVIGAGFALPRDAGRRPALHREIGVARRCWCRFRAPARCRSETGAPGREIGVARRRWCGFRAPARCRSETGASTVRLWWRSVDAAGFALPRDAGWRPALHVRLAWRGVVGAGFALPRDAGRRPALHVRLAWRSVVGAGFALPRDAGRRPALHVRLAVAQRCRRCRFRAPARCRSETGAPREIGVARRCWCGFRAPARCRSETGAPREIGGGRRRRCGFRAPARCRSETGAPP